MLNPKKKVYLLRYNQNKLLLLWYGNPSFGTSLLNLYKIMTCSVPSGVKGKGKGLPQQASTGPSGSRQVKAPDFLDIRHYKGNRSSALRTGRLYPRRNPWYSFLEAESTPGYMVPLVAMIKIPSD